jgi:hypothetical protein
LDGFNPSGILDKLIEISQPSSPLADARRLAILVLKNTAKNNYAIIKPQLSSLVPALMLSVRDRTIPIKLAADRAMVYALQLKNGDTSVLDPYLKTLDAQLARSIGDYARRVLSKIAERDSDEETDFE